jgi:predicted ATPase/transcriptional regulator with XRE-family HTH domain
MATIASSSFGTLLRQLRLSAGLTQEALAERAGVSARGIQDLERGVRIAPRAETVRLLADALVLSEQSRASLIASAHPELAVPPPVTRPAASRLPRPPTPLIGRERDVAAGCAVLRNAATTGSARLLTLSGPGGVGKTRLALAIASEIAADYADGVVWVDLAPAPDPSHVAAVIAEAVGLREGGERPVGEQLRAALSGQSLLLVIDNCEHVLPAMPLIGMLLAGAPRLAVLASSRARLRLRGEREQPVEPLDLPEIGVAAAPHLAEIEQAAAVRLFVERAVDARPGFALRADNAAAVAAICRQLDGLPLALELAAARTNILLPEALQARLAQRLPLLTGGARDAPERQQTMRQAIAWSHDLLREAERVVFRRLAAFTGGSTLDAAIAVVAGTGRGSSGQDEVLDGLSTLVEQSLLRSDERFSAGAAAARVAMLETVREYALERLEASGEADAVRRDHAMVYLELAERAEPELTGPAQAEWLGILGAEHDNLRSALSWSLGAGDSAIALRLTGALARFWRMRGHPREGLSWLERALALEHGPAPAARGKALEGAGRIAHDLGQSEKAAALSEAALGIWRTLDDRHGQARVLDDLGNVAHDRGEFTRSIALHEQALVLVRESGDRRATGRSLNNLAMVALYQSQDERAENLYCEALAHLREVGDSYGVNVVLTNLGIVAIRRGELDRAAALSGESLAGCRELGDEQGVGAALINLAEVAHLQGDLGHAAALYDEARSLLHDLGDERSVAEAAHGQACLALTRGESEHAAMRFGESLALAYKLDDKVKVADVLEGLAAVAIRQDRAEQAVDLLGTAAALRERLAARAPAHRHADLERCTAECRAALDEAVFTAAWSAGHEWTIERAADEANQLTEAMARQQERRATGAT